MNEFYVNNREVIKNLGLNTGTSAAPAFTPMCTATRLVCVLRCYSKKYNHWCCHLY